MSDITHDVVDDGFHEIHLSGKQLVFLFMATMVVSVVIFLIGVFVGRNVRAQQAADHLADPDRGARGRSAGPGPGSLGARRCRRRAAGGRAPIAARRIRASSATRSDSKGSLSGTSEARSLPVSSRSHDGTAPPAPAPAAVHRRRGSRARLPRPRPRQQGGTVGTPQPGTWVIQVHALRDRTAAAGIVRRLASKGYPAFLVAAGPPTGTYKVQIGRYKDRDEAMRVIDRLKKEEQFNPWITR